MENKNNDIDENANSFFVSDGNITVLETIPRMMRDGNYRRRLRALVFDFILKTNVRRKK